MRPTLLRQAYQAIGANAAIAVVSILSVLIIPRLIGVDEYGYWQLFVFYSSYVLFAQLGLGDGAYLRYGGRDKLQLAAVGVGHQTVLLGLVQCLVAIAVFAAAPTVFHDPSRSDTIRLVAAYAVLANVRHFILLQLQATSDFALFSRVTYIDRGIYVLLVVAALATEHHDYRLLIGAEIVAKLASLAIVIACSRDMLRFDRLSARQIGREVRGNIYVGMKLTIANTSNMLIIGVVRFAIDRTWTVATFGTVSLVLNLSSFFMLFVNAVGFVLFPALRRAESSKLPTFYANLRRLLSAGTLLLLLTTPLLQAFVRLWLPAYSDAIPFVTLLLPLIIFEARMGLLILPMLKAKRQENAILAINLTSLGVSLILALIFGYMAPNLNALVLSILLAVAARAYLAEAALLRDWATGRSWGILVELVLTATFVVSAWLFEPVVWVPIYCLLLLLACVLARAPLRASVRYARAVLRSGRS